MLWLKFNKDYFHIKKQHIYFGAVYMTPSSSSSTESRYSVDTYMILQKRYIFRLLSGDEIILGETSTQDY